MLAQEGVDAARFLLDTRFIQGSLFLPESWLLSIGMIKTLPGIRLQSIGSPDDRAHEPGCGWCGLCRFA